MSILKERGDLLQSVDHGHILPDRLGHTGCQVVAQLVVNVELARGTRRQEGIVDSICLSHNLLDPIHGRCVVGVLLRCPRRRPALPHKIIHVEIEGQVLLAVRLPQVLAE